MKNEFYLFYFPDLHYIQQISKQRLRGLWMAWTFPFYSWLQTYHLERNRSPFSEVHLALVRTKKLKILELLPHHFAIRQHWQFVGVVFVVRRGIVQNSIVSIDEVLVSFHFHY